MHATIIIKENIDIIRIQTLRTLNEHETESSTKFYMGEQITIKYASQRQKPVQYYHVARLTALLNIHNNI